MKRFTKITTLLLIILAIYWSFQASMPTYESGKNSPENEFSTDRALSHVKTMSQKPHGVGFPAHAEVRSYIISQLESMGLETSLQEGYTAGDWGNLSKVINILARIKGSEKGKALLLLSHYDSSPHSSLGASDAGSGVATILEGIRAFLSENKQPKNDIIILITDAEELGLNGADLFVNKHPWAEEVGLTLNFEARGSGGPSYMLVETNRGNGKLIEEFTKANPEFPVANSLVYSIYKMLPNDTDLTVFREDGDIEGFNFAFIDDHYDYHTVRDSYERLNQNTLAHQGSYLMSTLSYFANSDLNSLKSLDDSIYFNVPFFKLVSYPFEWIWPMFGLAVLFFIVLIAIGFKKNILKSKDIAKGFIPPLIALVINGVVGYYSWSVLKWVYPEYKDILHGFTYNGHMYILVFVVFAVATCFWSYHKFNKVDTPNLLVAPIFLWLVICGLVSYYLQGASFFIVPVFALLASFMVVINQKEPSAYLLFLLAIPALWIYSPFIKMFPIGLGLKMMVAATLLTSLTFLLLLPIFGYYKNKQRLAFLGFALFFGFMISAHFKSDFDKENAKPNSLLYVLDVNEQTAQWATYEHVVSNWTAQYIGPDRTKPQRLSDKTISSKYSSGFTYVTKAPLKEILPPKIDTSRDTIIGNQRHLEICISPQRNVNRLEVFTNDIKMGKASVNGIQLSEHYLKNRRRGKLITHYVSNNDFTELNLVFPKDVKLKLTIYEASNDLLSNPQFSVPERPEDNIPMPFVLNDAILTTKTLTFE
ncbi:M28 family peptidase [Maribacter sp. HTCC2170]|uniref:M28 family peptidase n=1 Tax=Maribacter sp. (strain HTCC2170 / KCCM 42371) TaxID=313603 RepID=UPI00006BD1D7|nr:M28 family peptidase [Maribacter sp. HTCC2170]EAR02499.1 peptidase, M20/M25/M40 family protein [Maribacter sp. HTCC2170]